MKTAQVHDGKFGWMRSADGAWVIGGPAGAADQIVKVTKRDGSSKFYRTGSQLIGSGWGGATLYEACGEVSVETSSSTTTSKYARWAKRGDIWIVLGMPGLKSGSEIIVQKKNGETQTKIVVSTVAGEDGAYHVADDRREAHDMEGGLAGTPTARKYSYEEVDNMIADMDLDYKYPTRASIWGAVRILNAGGRL